MKSLLFVVQFCLDLHSVGWQFQALRTMVQSNPQILQVCLQHSLVLKVDSCLHVLNLVWIQNAC